MSRKRRRRGGGDSVTQAVHRRNDLSGVADAPRPRMEIPPSPAAATVAPRTEIAPPYGLRPKDDGGPRRGTGVPEMSLDEGTRDAIRRLAGIAALVTESHITVRLVNDPWWDPMARIMGTGDHRGDFTVNLAKFPHIHPGCGANALGALLPLFLRCLARWVSASYSDVLLGREPLDTAYTIACSKVLQIALDDPDWFVHGKKPPEADFARDMT